MTVLAQTTIRLRLGSQVTVTARRRHMLGDVTYTVEAEGVAPLMFTRQGLDRAFPEAREWAEGVERMGAAQ